jgi:tRNA threonylcarbamoyladenosine biosynthesis protein TsaE
LELVLVTMDEGETFQLAKMLGQLLQQGDFIALNGDLGAGKTVFAKGVAAGLEICEPVTSPTFTIVQEYQGRLPFFHFDTYRLSDCWDLEDMGYEEYFYGNGVCLVEWSEKVAPLLPGDYLEITIEKPGKFTATNLAATDTARRLRLVPRGERSGQVLEELRSIVDIRN